MKVITVNGYHHSGKTTIVTNLVKELQRRGYSVGSVKQIHSEKFHIDSNPTTNTGRHRGAGSQLVSALCPNETNIMIPRHLSTMELLSYYHFDYVILESVRDCIVPRIIASSSLDEIEPHNIRTICVSGLVAIDNNGEYNGLPILNSEKNIIEIADLVEKYAFEPLPGLNCGKCGYNCEKMSNLILKGIKNRNQCRFTADKCSFFCDGKPIGITNTVYERNLYDILQMIVGENLSDYNVQIKIESKDLYEMKHTEKDIQFF